MAPLSTIRLFDAEPDLLRYVAPRDHEAAKLVSVPLHIAAPGGLDVHAVLKPAGAFGALVLDGMILQSLRLGEHAGLRLLGPGDVLSLTDSPRSMLVLEESCRVTTTARLALLERESLLAARRWPWLVAGLHARMAEGAERLTTQLMICQLPRVDDRLLSLLWLLAESWGQVTRSGTVLPIELTHSVLGGLVGARRPTVTLALSDLTDRGALMRQTDGWLLLEPPPVKAAGQTDPPGEPRLLRSRPASWSVSATPLPGPPRPTEDDIRELRLRLAALREEQARRTARMRASAELMLERRELIRRRNGDSG